MVAGGRRAVEPEAAAAALVRALGAEPFDAGLVLGSGLGGLVAAIGDARAVAFDALPGFPPAGVAGHAGRWIGGTLEGRRVLVQAGRYHLYEGHAPEVVGAPARVMAALGVRTLILTNAAGGIRPTLTPGALMSLRGHLDLMTSTALDLSPDAARESARCWDPGLRSLAHRCAADERIPLEEGVYAGVLGPSYETPAEIRMLARLGADVVGMSTVPEAAAAASLDVRCLGLSLVTNPAAGIVSAPLAHAEVIEAGRRAAPTLERLLRAVVRALPA